MDVKKIFWILILVGMLICSGLVIGYYWTVNTLIGVTDLPVVVLLFAVIYIGLQLIKRTALKIQHWWDWTYYLGLIAIVLPVVFGSEKNETIFHLITDYGSLFLLLPILLDGYKILKK